MKILLLNPCDDRFRCEQGEPVFGLLNLGTYLLDRGHEVRGIDLNYPYDQVRQRYLRSPKYLVDEIRRFAPEICGITTLTHTRYNAYYWAKVVKKLNPKTTVIFGGIHASAEPESILSNIPEVDFVVIGEGEITADELCQALKNKGDLARVRGIAYRNNGKVVLTADRELVADINQLPIINRGLFLRTETIPKVKVFEMMTGRGCPSRCKFCSSASFWKGQRRMRSAESVIKELRLGMETFPRINFIRFKDETLLTDKSIAYEVMEELKKIGLPWECCSRVIDLDEEAIKMLKSCGCWRVRIGIETGSKKLMRDLRKPVNLDEVPKLFSLLRKYKLRYSPSIILGLPNSTPEDVFATLDLIKKMKTDPDHCTISMSTFLYPGTDYYLDFKREHPDFSWENTPEKYKKLPCVKDIYGNYLYPLYTFKSGLFKWKCHLFYISSTFSSHPVNSLKRFFSLISLFFVQILKMIFKRQGKT